MIEWCKQLLVKVSWFIGSCSGAIAESPAGESGEDSASRELSNETNKNASKTRLCIALHSLSRHHHHQLYTTSNHAHTPDPKHSVMKKSIRAVPYQNSEKKNNNIQRRQKTVKTRLFIWDKKNECPCHTTSACSSVQKLNKTKNAISHLFFHCQCRSPLLLSISSSLFSRYLPVVASHLISR